MTHKTSISDLCICRFCNGIAPDARKEIARLRNIIDTLEWGNETQKTEYLAAVDAVKEALHV